MNWKNQLKSIFKWNKEIGHYDVWMTCITHTGNLRTSNEDNFCFGGKYMPLEHQSMKEVRLLKASSRFMPAVAVFDGMGGESAGELASYTAARNFVKSNTSGAWDREVLSETFLTLNEAVCSARKKQRYSRIGSTAIAAVFGQSQILIGNVGDSPAFRFRDGQLERISCLHTNADFLKEQGITNKKPGITQFLGIDPEEFIIEPFTDVLEVQENDLYLLCSDGLTDMLMETEIEKILSLETTIRKKTKQLLEEALLNGGKDNITIVLCEIQSEK